MLIDDGCMLVGGGEKRGHMFMMGMNDFACCDVSGHQWEVKDLEW